MGEFADDVVARLKNGLVREKSAYNWKSEYGISGTPVDLAGVSADSTVLIELEWRRADPADNTAKIFRHLSDSESMKNVTVVQLFTHHYDLVSGGISSKRKNAEFVGRVAAESLDELNYCPIGFGIDPPKSGEERPPGWKEKTDAMTMELASIVG
ncbi:hypothetical protein [Halorubrum tibetense]|uniref:Restriction endonuclease type IV Mrr domain-containing protein n=1 Tax=Halorubrum tibetense TaxID=175631 RepID=A0ABD5S6E7_9EURY